MLCTAVQSGTLEGERLQQRIRARTADARAGEEDRGGTSAVHAARPIAPMVITDISADATRSPSHYRTQMERLAVQTRRKMSERTCVAS